MSASKALMLLSFEIAQVIRSPVCTYSWRVSGLGTAGSCARPHEVAKVVVDVWSGIEISIRREEDISRREELWTEDAEVYYRCVEVGSL